jgi:hypothetical protein
MMDEKLIGKKQGNKSNWRLVLKGIKLRSSFAIAFCPGVFTGIVGFREFPAQAAPAIKPAIALESTKDNLNDSLQTAKVAQKIAQVGISSPSNAPIPLNLRPRFHIPLPTDSRSRDDDYHSEYEHGYEQGYDHGYDDGYHRGKHHDRHRKDTVIIINPATSSTYENSYENYGNDDLDNYNRDNHQRRYIRIIRNQVSF